MAGVVEVSKTEDGTRLLRWFLRRYPAMPQKEFYRLCRGGQIRVNSSRVDSKKVLCSGDIVRIPPTIKGYAQEKPQRTESGERFSLSDLESLRKCIVHNDKDVVVFNKPAGLAVQGGTGIRKSLDKMAAALFPYDKISLVHRLDKETSGLLIVAKNQRAAQILSEEFKTRTAHKEYLALLNGKVKEKHGIIDNYMIKGQVFNKPVRPGGENGPKAQRAITEYKVLSGVGNRLSWVLFLPRTGRTHQLRIHSAYCLDAPIVGDNLYGQNKKMDRMLNSMFSTNNLFLLAYRLTFRHPTTKKLITLQADIPDFMKPIIKFLEFKLP